MQAANLPPDLTRLHEDLAGRILASDEEGASRIYYEPLRAGRSLEILAEATRIPAIRKTIHPELFEHGAAMGQPSKMPDEPPQPLSASLLIAALRALAFSCLRAPWQTKAVA